MRKEQYIHGYLPDERPPIGKLILYAIQQVIVMFPATVTVALITDFHISTTIFASGLATLCFILVTRGKLPLYYGSSFSYIAAIAGLMSSEFLAGATLNDKIAHAQFGIVMSGLVSIAAGLIVMRFGRESIEKVLPATITGPIATVIGLTLAGVALQDASMLTNPATGIDEPSSYAWIVSLITLLATILFSVYLKGFWGQLPLLLGPLVGVVVSYLLLLVFKVDMFKVLPETASRATFAVPIFTLPKPSWAAIAALMPIALATIPESTAHVFQLDVYVNDLARKKQSAKKYNIADKLGSNLIGDGIGDIVAGAIGGPAGTNYGENISAMAITKVFSIPVLVTAAIFAMILSFFSPLINAIYGIPRAVIGGLEIYLFGAIAAQGIAIMIDRKVDMFSPKNISVIASVCVIGIGGHYAFGGAIPFFGIEVPAIAGAAIFGILLNLLLSIGGRKADVQPVLPEDEDDATPLGLS